MILQHRVKVSEQSTTMLGRIQKTISRYQLYNCHKPSAVVLTKAEWDELVSTSEGFGVEGVANRTVFGVPIEVERPCNIGNIDDMEFHDSYHQQRPDESAEQFRERIGVQ